MKDQGHHPTGRGSGTGCSAGHIMGKSVRLGSRHSAFEMPADCASVWKTNHCPAAGHLESVESYSPSCPGREPPVLWDTECEYLFLYLSPPQSFSSPVSVFIFKRQQQFNQNLLTCTKYKIYNGHYYKSCL